MTNSFPATKHKWTLDPHMRDTEQRRLHLQPHRLFRNVSQNAVKTQASIKAEDMAGGSGQQEDAEGRSGSPSAARGSDPSSAQMEGVGHIITARAAELITLLESFQFCPAKCNHSHVRELILSRAHWLLLLPKAKKNHPTQHGELLALLLPVRTSAHESDRPK